MAEQIPPHTSHARTPAKVVDACLKKMEEDAKLERYKSILLFGSGLAAIMCIGGVCVWIIVSQNPERTAFQWATATLTSMVTGILGYVTGRSASKV